jgi:hypothetical protein
MAAKNEVRIAVGEPAARRSTVWKFAVHRADIYILSRFFGSDSKVSLHASGYCQWSNTDAWVRKDAERKNQDRHITKWFVPRPDRSPALHAFQIRIPESELRHIETEEDLKSVRWLPAPPRGRTLSLECYISSPTPDDPAIFSALPHPLLFSMQLADLRWLVVLHQIADLDGKDLEQLSNKIWEEARAAGIEPKPEYRAAAFTESGDTLRGMIELAPPASALPEQS